MVAAAQTMDDNRLARRFVSDATLAYVPFTSRKVQTIAVDALNCSTGGLSFRSPLPLKPGQTICIHMRPTADPARPREQGGALLKSFALAEVRWSARAGGLAAGYRVGVKYI